jgi:hypothetical protein
VAVTPAPAAVAFRYCCSAATSPLCDRGDGQPTRPRCGHCGATLDVEAGQWGAFEWTSHGRYDLEAAVRTFPSRPLADEWAEARNLVVRFVPSAEPAPAALFTVLRGGRS